MNKLRIDLYRRMYLIRQVERRICQHYLDDEMKTPMHMSMGGEAIAAGVCGAMRPEDQVLGSYRSHGIYLAKALETDRFFGEMYGRVTGTSQGKGGSMHLLAPEHGLICTSAIVASHIPVAVGAAFANRATGNGKVVAAFFGDGAIDEGAFWESLNAACLMKLPVLLVCEDNGYAVHSPAPDRHGYPSIAAIVEQFDCHVESSDSTDAEVIHQLASEALVGVRQGDGPAFLHLRYYRYLEHVGVFEDFKAGYRPREESEPWHARDPVSFMRDRLLGDGAEEEVLRIESSIDEQVEKSLRAAQEAPFPDGASVTEGVFA